MMDSSQPGIRGNEQQLRNLEKPESITGFNIQLQRMGRSGGSEGTWAAQTWVLMREEAGGGEPSLVPFRSGPYTRFSEHPTEREEQ